MNLSNFFNRLLCAAEPNSNSRLNSQNHFGASRSSTRSTRKRKYNPLVLETLEDRQLLSVTPYEYEAICQTHAEFGLPASPSDINIIELDAESLTAENLQAAIDQAAQTPQDDLVVVRTTEEKNCIHTNSAIDIDFDTSSSGSLSIIGYGNSLLTISSNSETVMSVSSGKVNLGGIELLSFRRDPTNLDSSSVLVCENEASVATSRIMTFVEYSTNTPTTKVDLSYGPSTSIFCYGGDFQISGNTYAFVRGLSSSEYTNVKAKLSASNASYVVGDFFDAEKDMGDDKNDTQGDYDDDLLCWAGTCSNMLYYTGWANSEVKSTFTSEDKVFD